MPKEIEVKYRCPDPCAVEERVRRAGGEHRGRVLELNTLYDHPDRRLLERDCAVRLRTATPIDSLGNIAGPRRRGGILTYKGPQLPGRFKVREEIETAVEDAGAADAILTALGLEPVLSFEKRRSTWILASAEVLLDELPRLGHFIEIEAGEAEIEKVARELGLDAQGAGLEVVPRSYPALVRELFQDTRGAAALRFPIG